MHANIAEPFVCVCGMSPCRRHCPPTPPRTHEHPGCPWSWRATASARPPTRRPKNPRLSSLLLHPRRAHPRPRPRGSSIPWQLTCPVAPRLTPRPRASTTPRRRRRLCCTAMPRQLCCTATPRQQGPVVTQQAPWTPCRSGQQQRQEQQQPWPCRTPLPLRCLPRVRGPWAWPCRTPLPLCCLPRVRGPWAWPLVTTPPRPRARLLRRRRRHMGPAHGSSVWIRHVGPARGSSVWTRHAGPARRPDPAGRRGALMPPCRLFAAARRPPPPPSCCTPALAVAASVAVVAPPPPPQSPSPPRPPARTQQQRVEVAPRVLQAAEEEVQQRWQQRMTPGENVRPEAWTGPRCRPWSRATRSLRSSCRPGSRPAACSRSRPPGRPASPRPTNRPGSPLARSCSRQAWLCDL